MALAKAAPPDWAKWFAAATGMPLEHVREKLGVAARNGKIVLNGDHTDNTNRTARTETRRTSQSGPRHRRSRRTTVTSTDLSATPPPAAPLDGCPRCVSRNNPATDARRDYEGGWAGITAVYRCLTCSHNWTTSWGGA